MKRPEQEQRRQWVMAFWLAEAFTEARKLIRQSYSNGTDDDRKTALGEFREWCKRRIAEVDSVLEEAL